MTDRSLVSMSQAIMAADDKTEDAFQYLPQDPTTVVSLNTINLNGSRWNEKKHARLVPETAWLNKDVKHPVAL